MKIEKLLLQHGAAAVITTVVYQVLAGCDFAEAVALVSTYIFILLAIVQADIWRKEKRYGRYERGKTGSGSDRVSGKTA